MPSIIGHAALQQRASNLHSNEGRRVRHILELAAKNKEDYKDTSAKIVEVILESDKIIGFENAIANVAYCIKHSNDLNQNEAKILCSLVYERLESLLKPLK